MNKLVLTRGLEIKYHPTGGIWNPYCATFVFQPVRWFHSIEIWFLFGCQRDGYPPCYVGRRGLQVSQQEAILLQRSNPVRDDNVYHRKSSLLCPRSHNFIYRRFEYQVHTINYILKLLPEVLWSRRFVCIAATNTNCFLNIWEKKQ